MSYRFNFSPPIHSSFPINALRLLVKWQLRLTNTYGQSHPATGCSAETTFVLGRQGFCNSHEGRLAQRRLRGVCL